MPLPLQSVSQIDERRRSSKWTRIHPIFAIGQLLVFLVSALLLVLYYNGRVSFHAVHISVLIKVAFMAGGVITGAYRTLVLCLLHLRRERRPVHLAPRPQ